MRLTIRKKALALCAACFAAVTGMAAARGPAHLASSPGALVVGFERGLDSQSRLSVIRAADARAAGSVTDDAELVEARDVRAAAARLRRTAGVAYAVRDQPVQASDFIPNDPGFGGRGGWQAVQWNFTGPAGVGAPAAWDIARRDHAAGGRGVLVAVIDSGLAYENRDGFRRDPDLAVGRRIVAPFDFLANGHHPDDGYGHGTHVTSTIAEATNNRIGLTGLAYRVRIMPLKVLDRNGDGDGATVARAVRYAVAHHAQVINLSVEFDSSVRAHDIPYLIDALSYAHRHGVALVGAAGNDASSSVSYPAASRYVIAVGATTADGCLADYSNFGRGLALVAPGGGADAALGGDAYDRAHCHPGGTGRGVYQEAFLHHPRHFTLVGFHGTSFATPHVTAAIALLLATRRLGRHPSPAALERRLLATARPLGPGGRNSHYGAGLLDIPAALGP